MLLMERFYRGHLGTATVLRAVQRWLRDSTAEQLKLAERWAQVYRTTTDPGLKKAAFNAMSSLHSQERPFAHPYHWAAFCRAHRTRRERIPRATGRRGLASNALTRSRYSTVANGCAKTV
jgi:hypothetical protein